MSTADTEPHPQQSTVRYPFASLPMPDHRYLCKRSPYGVGVVSLLVAALFAGAVPAQFSPDDRRKASIEAFADKSAYRPGDTAQLVVRATVADGWHLQSHEPTFDYLIPTELSVSAQHAGGELVAGAVDYPPHEMWQSQFEAEPLAVYQGQVHFQLDLPLTADVDGLVELNVELVYQACDERICLPPTEAMTVLLLEIGEGGEAQNGSIFAAAQSDPTAAQPPSSTNTGLSLWAVLPLALLGGLILNAMPCVLPVLSIKVFGLVQAAGQGRRQVTAGALATAAGIVASFWALAALAIAARSAGDAVGWGIQFQNPGFVAILVVVLTLFSLNMWGLFEIPLPQRAASLGGGHHGLLGHFGTGLFATLMATPCSAPFLGTAVGFALSQPAGMIVLVFTAVGIGMALPYLALAITPAAADRLPRPGAWMESLKGLMGFLLAGTVVWLLYVLAGQIASPVLALFELTLLLVALSAWVLSRIPFGRTTARRVAGFAMVLLAIAAVALARTGAPGASEATLLGAIDWLPFDEAEAQRLAASGEMVFVDVTADWCATCKVNERLVLYTDAVTSAFERHGVVPMKADWTNRNDVIADYLARHGRYAIPFYVLYRPGAEPHVFGELLTKGSVLRALEESASRVAVQ